MACDIFSGILEVQKEEENKKTARIAGIHVHPAVIRSVFRMYGDDRVVLISDSTESCGIPLESAVKATAKNPAKSIGMENQIGSFMPGAYADCLFVD